MVHVYGHECIHPIKIYLGQEELPHCSFLNLFLQHAVNPVIAHCTRVSLYSGLPSILSTDVLWLLLESPVILKVMPRVELSWRRTGTEAFIHMISETACSSAEHTNTASSNAATFTDEGSLVSKMESTAITCIYVKTYKETNTLVNVHVEYNNLYS